VQALAVAVVMLKDMQDSKPYIVMTGRVVAVYAATRATRGTQGLYRACTDCSPHETSKISSIFLGHLTWRMISRIAVAG
jgi:hypothetical protein